MTKHQLNPCTTAYEFDELDGFLTYCYLIEKADTYYVIDTFCGPEAMAMVAKDMTETTKKNIVVNTHHHFDHIWGNCYFKGADIVAHNSCKELIEMKFKEDCQKYQKYLMGNVEIVPPNVTFERQYILEDDLTLTYTPGHTIDGISLYDGATGLLIVGDNLELPLVYIEDEDLGAYCRTLSYYKSLKSTCVSSGHCLTISEEQVEEIDRYLYKMKEGLAISFKDQDKQRIHEENLRTLETINKKKQEDL